MTALTNLFAISPLDGRYWAQAHSLATYFSEYGLMYYRVRVEIEYLIAFCEISQLYTLSREQIDQLRNIYLPFSEKDAQTIKDLEATTNHDVKAVEYFLQQRLIALGFKELIPYVHFGLTSQDVNNTAIPLSFKEYIQKEHIPALVHLIEGLSEFAESCRSRAMLARTHGQPASPTTMGKELFVFVERLTKQINILKQIPFPAKFGGATGNLNAHYVAFPEIDWVKFADHFVNQTLGLQRNRYTTQIDHYDGLAELFDALRRINVIIIDACRDLWAYISLDYLKLKIIANEVGSSAMPHKVNPIDFENAEGNAGFANALFDYFSNKLPISRLQRDLTDSTTLRNIGLPLGHSLLAIRSFQKGLSKIAVNTAQIEQDLATHWEVLAEAYQTILRREGYADAYEQLKAATRGNSLRTQADLWEVINLLKVNEEIKSELRSINPFNYIGSATQKY